MLALILVGFPATGKSTIAKELASTIPDTVDIAIDMFYESGKPNHNKYLNYIDNMSKTHNVILSSNNHTHESRDHIIEILKKNNVIYYFFNFVPENFENLEKDKQTDVIDILVGRIVQRSNMGDTSSPLTAEDDEKSKKRVRNIIVHGFVKTYEPPEKCVYLDFTDSVETNVEKIWRFLL